MAADLATDKFWVNKNLYHDAEKKYHEGLAKLHIRGQRRPELGKNSDLANAKKIKQTKTLKEKKVSEPVKTEHCTIEAKRNLKKNVESKARNYKAGLMPEEDPDCVKNNLIEPEKSEKEKEKTKKKSKNSKKSEKTKERDSLLGGVGMAKLNQDSLPKTTLAGEVAKARQHIKSSLECMENLKENGIDCMMNPRLSAILEKMGKSIENLTERVRALEIKAAAGSPPAPGACSVKSQTTAPKTPTKSAAKDGDDDDDVDLFGSESEEDEEAKKIREQRLAEYAAKKSKKPAVVAKSNIILDIKPWSDETDMKEMEKAVRAIEMDGLVWGASKLVPVAFKIFKLQIACVIEDDKVSVDLLTETLEGIEDYVQSVDIAAFNKV